MRAVLATLAVLLPAFAGCLGDAPAATEPLADDVDATSTTDPDTASSAAQARPEPSEPVADPVPPLPPAPDPCAEPVFGLDHACVADGFHFDDAVFWDGGDLPTVLETGTAAHCAATTGCRDLAFDVAETAPGARLRIDVQVFFKDASYMRPVADTGPWGTPAQGHETAMDLALFPPDVAPAEGSEAARGSTRGDFGAVLFVGGYDPETREPREGPAVGTWTLRITGYLPDEMAYRMRARLDPPTPPSDDLAYPDLSIIPAFDVGFAVPSSSFQPGAPTPVALPAASCMPEEHVEAQTHGLRRAPMCLRFSMGFANAGLGSWRLKMVDEPTSDPVALAPGAEISVVQSVCTADGRLCEDVPRPEGLVTRWDPNHGHYHFQNAYLFDLYRVVPATEEGSVPTLEHVSTSGKLGIAPGAEALVGWTTSWAQGPPWSPAGTTAAGQPDEADADLAAGWGDIYDWNRGGNYVPFPTDAALRPVAGEYVLRGTTDPDGTIAERDEGNNDGYTWFIVDAVGGIEVLERGYGRDPWEFGKTVADVTP